MVTDVMSGTRRIDLTDLAAAVEVLSDIDIPAELRDNLALFLRLERRSCPISTSPPSSATTSRCSCVSSVVSCVSMTQRCSTSSTSS